MAKAEEIEIGRDLLEQHVGPDQDTAPAAIAEPTPPAPTTRQSAPAKSKPWRLAARVNPMPSNRSPQSEPSGRRRIALHEPAISTATLTRSSRPTVATLCGIVTSAP